MLRRSLKMRSAVAGDQLECTTCGADKRQRLLKLGNAARRRGAAVAEFAIVAPVFFMMVIGFIEFGRALMVQQVLINASRVGARMASTTGATTTAVQTAVQSYTTGVAVPGVTVTVSPDPASAPAGSTIT